MTNALQKHTCPDCRKVAWSRNPYWNHPGCMMRGQAARIEEGREMAQEILAAKKKHEVEKALEAWKPLLWYKRIFKRLGSILK